ncbi:MAG: sugar kinase, partial [Chitinivibrionia bacterium]|nr:sugar kinase [Chitinivibrionia bacterium]
PAPDAKCEFRDMIVQGGGPVATALVALARWGVSTSFCGVVGDDFFGRLIGESLEMEGVRTEGLIRRSNSQSQFAFIVAEPGIGRRTVFWRRPTGPPVGPEELGRERIETARVFYTDGFFPAASIAGARHAKAAGVPVIVDAGSMREGMLDLAALSDCFIASQSFAHAYAKDRRPMDVCREVSFMGPGVACVTLGADGYVAFAHGKEIAGAALAVETVDTTGCGDVFHAGFVFGRLHGWNAEESLDFGAWAAAMVSRKCGGREGIPALSDWKRRKSRAENGDS